MNRIGRDHTKPITSRRKIDPAVLLVLNALLFSAVIVELILIWRFW